MNKTKIWDKKLYWNQKYIFNFHMEWKASQKKKLSHERFVTIPYSRGFGFLVLTQSMQLPIKIIQD